LIREAAMLKAWLSQRFAESRQLRDFSLRQVAQLMILRKLSYAPPLVERFARKVKNVGLEMTIDAVEANIRRVQDQLDTGSIGFRPPGALLSSIRNLRALSARHGKILRDRKAVRGGLLYGPPYIALVVLEVILDRRRVANIVARILRTEKTAKDDSPISYFLDGAGTIVSFARSKRNSWKDKVV
jgi:hypothetical protein